MDAFAPDREERRLGRWKSDRLESMAKVLAESGIIVLRAVVDRQQCGRLAEKMLADIEVATGLGRVDNDYQGIRPPPAHPWLFDSIVHNDFVIQCTAHVLGRGVCNVCYGSNTAYPGSAEQFVHADGGPLWRCEPYATHPTLSLVVNVPLVDVTEANGATRVFPGTHLVWDLPEARRPGPDDIAGRPSERALTRVGDVVIRDPRLWHNGMPNTTATPRPMIAMIHNAGCLHGGFQAEDGSQDFWASHPVLKHRVEFLPAPMDYRFPRHSHPTCVQTVGGLEQHQSQARPATAPG